MPSTRLSSAGALLPLLGGAAAVLLVVAYSSSGSSSEVEMVQKLSWQQQEQKLWRDMATDAVAHKAQRYGMLAQKRGVKTGQLVHKAEHRLHEIRSELAKLKAARKGMGAMPSVQRLASRNGVTYFRGHMLCAEGEKSCEHPCNAFYTVTEKPTDCHCKCTENPHSDFAGDVICTCPDSPIAAENDMFPYPEGEGPAAAPAPEAEVEAAPAAAAETVAETAAPAVAETSAEQSPETSEQPAAAEEQPQAVAQARRSMALNFYRRAAVLAAMRNQQGLASKYPSFGGAYFKGPAGCTGLSCYPPPPMLPPNGDYPGGSTGIPMDGYAAFDTGYGADPYHGMQSGMQNIGISDRGYQTNLGRRLVPVLVPRRFQ